ncbi:MAG: HEAT repeat domain-containing protein [Candidatus Thorarchaeota archaeon]|nr:HEAT repeat domain-containing protein [Candidatus Thorarchaeota archaeon]
MWGVHSDRYVNDVSTEGVVKVNVVSNRRFQDVSPASETTFNEVDLSIFDSSNFEDLVKLLEDPNPFVREVSAKLLGRLKDDRAISPHLIQAADDESKYVQSYAIAALGFLRLAQSITHDSKEGKQIVDRLIIALSDDYNRVRYNAVDGLRLFMGKTALNALESLEAIEDPEMKELAEKAIQQIKSRGDKKRSSWGHIERVHYELRDPEVIEELILFFMDESDEVQRSTQKAIGKFGERAYGRMMELLQDNEQHHLIRMGAAATLADIGDKRATDILIETLNDEHDEVRCNAAWALAELKDKRSVPALLKATKDTNWQVRLNTGAALGKIKGKGALDAVLKLVEDEHPQVREIASSYLGQFKSPRVMPALKARLKDENKDVREMARSWMDHLEKKKLNK